ncbi:MAG: hypothetical protein P0111_03885 [Nitrospira sp.]|nr:hypothetical protein [Nitrospira sp.]
MKVDRHTALAQKALRLKKAWLVGAALFGAGDRLGAAELTIPNYASWNNKRLKLHIDDLEKDFGQIAKNILLHWRKASLSSVIRWLSEQFDAWHKSGRQIYSLGRVYEVEAAIGPLMHRRAIDCPPYAEVLLQGFHGSAIRHPEYHLASDLALLYNLFLDACAIMDEAERQQQFHTSESSQSLGRSVILACFNLLESFVSGLATAWLMERQHDESALVDKVRDTLNDKRLSLRKRLLAITPLISGNQTALDESSSPIGPLFNECKQRRDSFVHCEPGPNPTQWGYIKEERFHDVSLAAVQKTVDLTCETISLVWKAVHGREKPSWLRPREDNGRFSRVDVTLRYADVTTSEGMK